ncbi:hypothetical protein [Prescottella equi]|uniref:hypothetical protein n=1 Tax=Rhodococcus hoagii TaxID=43767 RepID=UPI0023DCDC10|nr:hypothetical protein [Prescottella equi]
MSDTITPASLRAHADWLLATHGDSERLAGQLRSAANKLEIRLEAESARDEYVEQLADVLAVAEGGAHLDQLQGWRQTGLRDGIRAVLDRLAADGRLLPEGGTALTAEQVAEARELLDAVDLDAEEFHLLRAAFTPPAVSVPDSGPDGTPEKPWPTWQDVPEGVKYRSSDGCYCFVNRNGSRFPAARASESTIRSSFSDVVMGTLAPFVRVDGDKA